MIPEDFQTAPPGTEEKLETMSQVPEVIKDDKGELPITEEDKNKFFDAIMRDDFYYEDLPAFDGKMTVKLRTRMMTEGEEIIDYVRKMDVKNIVDLELGMGKCNLAYALVKINSTVYDNGTLSERIKRLDSLPVPKFIALLELMRRFDVKIGKLEKLSVSPNFWNAVSGTPASSPTQKVTR